MARLRRMIDATPEALQRFLADDDRRGFVLVQLIRFAEGGRQGYLAYAAAAQPILQKHGIALLYAGESIAPPLHGPAGVAWDGLVAVRYPSRAAYVELHEDPEYQALLPQRAAAVAEAWAQPMSDWRGR